MYDKYQNWINKNYPTPESARLKCNQASEEMIRQFPELTLIRGQILVEEPFDCPPSKTTHWWCITPDNEIIDPTAHQYPTRVLSYTPVDESRVPTGKCMNCGDISYNGSMFCCNLCEREFTASL